MTCWLILGTLALSFTGTVHADKIAIIVQTGDDKDFLGFTKSARVARETFQKRGYDRVVILGGPLSGAPATASGLRKTIEGLKNTTDLHLEFIGHGDVQAANQPVRPNQAMLPPERFPVIKLKPDERAGQLDTDIQKNPTGEVQFRMASDPDNFRTYIGAGDIRDALATFRRKHSSANISVDLENCYSAGVTEALASVADVYVTASAPRNDSAAGLRGYDEAKSSVRTFNKFIIAEYAAGHSWGEAFVRAQRAFIAELTATESHWAMMVGLPRNSTQEFIARWCDAKAALPEGRRADCASCVTNRPARDLALATAMQPSREALALVENALNNGICAPSAREPWLKFRAKVEAKIENLKNDLAQDELLHRGGRSKHYQETYELAGEDCFSRERGFRQASVAMSVDSLDKMFSSAIDCLGKNQESTSWDREGLSHQYLNPLIYDRQSKKLTEDITERQCPVLRAKVKLYQGELACSTQFAREASDGEWSRFDRLLKLGFSGGKQ